MNNTKKIPDEKQEGESNGIKKGGHGGVRPNSGRKKGAVNMIKKQMISIRLAPYILTWLKSRNESTTTLIENAIVNYYKIDKGE